MSRAAATALLAGACAATACEARCEPGAVERCSAHGAVLVCERACMPDGRWAPCGCHDLSDAGDTFDAGAP